MVCFVSSLPNTVVLKVKFHWYSGSRMSLIFWKYNVMNTLEVEPTYLSLLIMTTDNMTTCFTWPLWYGLIFCHIKRLFTMRSLHYYYYYEHFSDLFEIFLFSLFKFMRVCRMCFLCVHCMILLYIKLLHNVLIEAWEMYMIIKRKFGMKLYLYVLHVHVVL